MHRMGRSSAPPKTGKAKKSPKGSGESSAAEIGHAGTSKRRGRGRPRKSAIKELEADRPSSSSSGAEYELELPKDLEEETKAGASEAADGLGENDAMDEEMEQRKEQENEIEEEQDEEVEGGDDDDEEEYTAEPEMDDEDDKIFEENCPSPKKSSRKRGRPRKSGGRSRDAGTGSGTQKRPRPNSPSPRAADESREGGVSALDTPQEAKQAGEAKARALAAVQAFVAKLPPTVYGRDEGWISTKREAREALAETGAQASSRESASGGVKRERAAAELSEEEEWQEKTPKKSKSGPREERQKQQSSKRRQQQGKNSSQRVGKQHRRDIEKTKRGGNPDNAGGGGGGGGGRAEMATSGTGAGSNRESQILTAQKLTQRLGKSSVEGKFGKDDVLDVLRGLGELQESVELLQQSGCGKAVANVRKYFFGSQVKHNDKDVATAASALRSRWVATLGKGAPAPAPTPASTSASASGASSADGKRESAEESSRSHHNDRKFEASSAGAGPRGAAGGAIGRYAKHRENGRQGVKMKMKKGVGSKEDGKVGVKSEVVTATPSVTDDASPGGAVKKEAPQQAALDEGEKVGKDYLRRLRTAVFSMEGVEAQRLRGKVMSEMVVPRDFVLKSCDELRALARMI
ncbi:unnamed protein product [Ascophyllum nodosum]